MYTYMHVRIDCREKKNIYTHIYTYQQTNADLNNICSVWDNLHVYTHASMFIHITYTDLYIYICRLHM